MNNQIGDQLIDSTYKSSENGKSLMDEVSFLKQNYDYEKSSNLLSNSFEVMNLTDDANSENCSSLSHISYSESDENRVLTCHVLEEIRSTRQKLTFEWIKTMSCENSHYELDSSFNCSNNSSSDLLRTDSETDESMESPRGNDDDSIIFLEGSGDENLPELTFCFSEVVTEENCDSGFSFSTRGSLANCIDDDFLDDNDFELVFSTPLSATVLPDWNDIISEASELSQGFENEIFVDFFDLPAKSKALQKVNEKWQNDMSGVDEKPREPVKVTFAPVSDLVKVHCYKKTLEENQPYDTSALDRMRFQNRIEELNKLLSPILTLEHRTSVILRNYHYCSKYSYN